VPVFAVVRRTVTRPVLPGGRIVQTRVHKLSPWPFLTCCIFAFAPPLGMTKPEEFHALVKAAVRARWAPAGYQAETAKVALRIPDNVTGKRAAETFIRWLFRDPLKEGDGALLEILTAE
jgi:hypothetical protein